MFYPYSTHLGSMNWVIMLFLFHDKQCLIDIHKCKYIAIYLPFTATHSDPWAAWLLRFFTRHVYWASSMLEDAFSIISVPFEYILWRLTSSIVVPSEDIEFCECSSKIFLMRRCDFPFVALLTFCNCIMDDNVIPFYHFDDPHDADGSLNIKQFEIIRTFPPTICTL